MGSFYNYGLERLFGKNPAGEIPKTDAMHRGGIFCVPSPILFYNAFLPLSNNAKECQGMPFFSQKFIL